jgi:Fe-S cluster assembly protein SufD
MADLAKDGVSIASLSSGGNIADIRAEEPLSAFNAALLQDGLRIRVAANCSIDKPLALLAIDDGAQTLSQLRVIIDCETSAKLKVIELARSTGNAQFANMVSQVNLERGAELDYVRIQERDAAHIGINRLHAILQEGAQLRHSAADFGNTLARNDVVVDIAGPDANAELHGLYLAAGAQHIDNHLHVIHRVGPARSKQNYRGILHGQSRCVFNGKVEVMQGADGTDAQQSNRNLLLSERAEIDTKPELEIYADDVKCSHGTTVGQLDESAIFYLRSRGLSANEARRVLTRAFASEMLGSVTIDECREYLARAMEQRLDAILGGDQQ